MTNLISSVGLPYWLIFAGALLLLLGFVGLATREHGTEADAGLVANDQRSHELKGDVSREELYNRMAKKKRRDRWAEKFDDPPAPTATSKP